MSVSGTLTGPKQVQKLVEVNGFELEITLTDHLLIFEYVDRPGVIGMFGQSLGRNNVNIAGMQVSRASEGGNALSVLAVDSEVTTEIVQTVAAAADAAYWSADYTKPLAVTVEPTTGETLEDHTDTAGFVTNAARRPDSRNLEKAFQRRHDTGHVGAVLHTIKMNDETIHDQVVSRVTDTLTGINTAD